MVLLNKFGGTIMTKKTKRGIAATKTKTQNYLCVDVKTVTKGEVKENQPMHGALVMDKKNEHFSFRQRGCGKPHPESRWHLLDRTKHGKACMNARHVKVEFYIHHEDYESAAELADMLASEIETLGENLCDCPLPPATPYPFPKKGKGGISNDSNESSGC